MVILSQDKQAVINFDNVKSLELVQRTDRGASIEVNYNDTSFEIIAKYSSMDQGKKIINEIFTGYRGSSIYSMPADKKGEI